MHNSLGPLKGYRMLITASVNRSMAWRTWWVRGAQAAQDGLGQDAEPYLHLVEPGGMGRRVMQIDRGVAGQPPVMLGLMSAQVVRGSHAAPFRDVGLLPDS